MGSWHPFDLNQLVPPDVTSAISTVGNLVSTFVAELQTALATASPGVPSIDAPNPVALAAGALSAIVDGLLHAGKLHVLFVPVAKTFPAQPVAPLPPTLDDLQASLEIDLGPRQPIVESAYARLTKGSGGNAGFFTAFASSLMDPFDPNRPQYLDQHDAVAMTVVLVGESTYSGISQAASALDVVFGSPPGSSLAARTVPVPQGLRARPVGVPKASRIGVQLDWDPPAAPFSSPYFPGVATGVQQYAVIRSTDPRAASARSVLDFFPTQALKAGLVGGAAKQHAVIAVGSGRNSTFLDDDALLESDKTYFYCVAWQVGVDEGGTVTASPFDKVSNVVKIAPRAPAPSQTGTSPNWSAVGSAVEVVPSLAAAIDRLLGQIGTIAAPAQSPADRLKGAIATAFDAVTRLTARAADLADLSSRIAASLGRPMPALYATTMTSTSGGNAFLLSELSRRLGDVSDSTRPPFDHGEYVCGVCFVAGAPRIADLAAVIAFLEALFGPATAANPLMGILTAIDTAVTQAETALFGPNMQVLPKNPDGTVTMPDGSTALPGEIDPITGKRLVPPTPAIALDGTAVATTDPANPNAGDTNIVPIDSLC